jgi:hypothetical protein
MFEKFLIFKNQVFIKQLSLVFFLFAVFSLNGQAIITLNQFIDNFDDGGITEGMQISNKAEIYFDYNSAVVII